MWEWGRSPENLRKPWEDRRAPLALKLLNFSVLRYPGPGHQTSPSYCKTRRMVSSFA